MKFRHPDLLFPSIRAGEGTPSLLLGCTAYLSPPGMPTPKTWKLGVGDRQAGHKSHPGQQHLEKAFTVLRARSPHTMLQNTHEPG